MSLKKNPKFDLKLKYRRTFEISLIVSFIFLIAAFKLFPVFEKSNVKIEIPQELINVEDIEATKQNEAPPPPPKPPIPIEAPSDDVLEDIEIQNTELDINAVVEAPPPPPVVNNDDEVVPDFFIVVEKQPEPIGGMQAIHDKIVYPPIALRAGVQGRVFVNAFVDEKGDVQKVELLKGIGAGCDEEIMRVVKETKFNPGRQRGKPVKVQVSMSFLFTLKDN